MLTMQVEAGWDTLLRLEEAGSDDGTPSEECTILDCGELPLEVDPAALLDEERQEGLAGVRDRVEDKFEQLMAEQQQQQAAASS